MKPTKKGQFSESDLNLAIRKVKAGEVSKREACRQYKIGRATLNRYLEKAGDESYAKKISKSFANTVFNEEEESLLAQYVIKCSKMFYGLSIDDLCRLAWQFAIANEKTPLPTAWSKDSKAGMEWSRGFRRRHSLSLRIAESTSLARASAFNPTNVQLFHKVYQQALEQFPFAAMNVWNLDETGVSTVTKIQKLIAQKGDRQVGGISSAERGTLVTLCACVNAAGRTLAPVLIYPRKKVQSFWATAAPPGTLTLANESGWMTSMLFPEVLHHFIQQMGATKENPQILIFDNHNSRITIEVVNLARDSGVAIVTLPAHCSHKMQPLDVGVMYPFKTYYANEVRSWHHSNPGRALNIHDVGSLVKTSFNKAFTIENIVNGFQKSGIWPPNPISFTEADFMGAEPSEQPLQENPIPIELPEEPSSSGALSPEQVRPLPKAPTRKSGPRRGRERRIPVILTSTPQKNKLLQIHNKRNDEKKVRNLDKKALDKLLTDSSGDERDFSEMDEVTELTSNPSQEFVAKNMKVGERLHVQIKGGRRQSVTYRYVVQTLESFNEGDNWFRVQGYRSINVSKTKFQVKENDVFEVEFGDVVCSLVTPTLTRDRAVTYEFDGVVEAKEA